ncbi:hypothetical protein L2E82_22430 [Cichorium intybus]|uniref:Uncharacterized protein n=1 Tax=Cichorium intybus TaxID=13427 RepID=A0ACB9DYP2_CICIN|nr:hypothetical protein L2E82_22430 [Cichorium intybus]
MIQICRFGSCVTAFQSIKIQKTEINGRENVFEMSINYNHGICLDFSPPFEIAIEKGLTEELLDRCRVYDNTAGTPWIYRQVRVSVLEKATATATMEKGQGSHTAALQKNATTVDGGKGSA